MAQKPSRVTAEEAEAMARWMLQAHEQAALGSSKGHASSGAVLVDPTTQQQVAAAHDCALSFPVCAQRGAASSSRDNSVPDDFHPLQHSTIACIDQVAAI